MRVAAIVAEYNPFHNGHRAQVEKTREAGATHVTAIMGGNFLQRGEAALFEKRARARAALLGGVDLVVELPLCYAMATAEHFAYGALSSVAALGVVELFSFGSESGELPELLALARTLESQAFRDQLRLELPGGESFAKVRQRTVANIMGEGVAALLEGANNTLGVEYLRQILRQRIPLTPMTVRRIGAGHDGVQAVGRYASASHLRQLWRNDLAQVSAFAPQDSLAVLLDAQEQGLGPVDTTRLENSQLAHLRRLTPSQLSRLPDVSEGLENRIYHAVRAGVSVPDILARAKTKRYPMARLRRILLAAYLGLEGRMSTEPPPYLRILGYNRRGTEILAAARDRATLPLFDSLARLREQGERADRFAQAEALATDLYTAALPTPIPCGYEYTAPAVRLL